MGIGSVGCFRTLLQPQFMGNIPCVLFNDGFMGIGENHQFIGCGGSALLRFEILADGFAQHRMSQIFLPVQNVPYGGCTPAVGVCNLAVSAIFRKISGGMSRRYQYLFR